MLFLALPAYDSHEVISTFVIVDNFEINFDALIKHLGDIGLELRFKLLPEFMIADILGILASRGISYSCWEDKDSFDYLIDVNDFVSAAGSPYRHIRWRMSRFTSNWASLVEPYSFDPTSPADVELAEALVAKWCRTKSNRGMSAEFVDTAYSRFLTAAQRSNRIGFTCFCLNGEMIGLTGWELAGDNTAVGHFLLHDFEIANIFYYVVRETCKELVSHGVKVLNIEQDLGLSGLRAAKQSLRPAGFLKKYSLEIELS